MALCLVAGADLEVDKQSVGKADDSAEDDKILDAEAAEASMDAA
jgi:hypothetical protein